MKYLIKSFLSFATLIATVLISIPLHELGHAATAKALDYENIQVFVWPGWQIFPKIEKKKNKWIESNIAVTQISPKFKPTIRIENSSAFLAQDIEFVSSVDIGSLPINKKELAYIQVMGSGLTWITSVIALFLLYFRPQAKTIKFTLLPMSLLYYDLCLYVFLPTFFELRHLVFWGGQHAEPLHALMDLGMDKHFVIFITGIIFTCQTLLLTNILTKKPRTQT